MLSPAFVSALEAIVSPAFVRRDEEARARYGADALKDAHPPDLVVLPASTAEVAAVACLCNAQRVPLTPRGAGTGYTGGAVPLAGGIVLSLERLNRIIDIDETNLIAVVEPHVVTAELQRAVEAVGLFYPPDPASLEESVIGGNIAECAGGPRAFKYGTTRQYVLGLEAVLPTGEVIHTGGRTVKNVVGYDLTRLLVGSEGTLAIVTQAILRLIPRPPARATLRATFGGIDAAVDAVGSIVRARVVPAALELVDGPCLAAVASYVGRPLAPDGTGALLLIEVDGAPEAVAAERDTVAHACRAAGATAVEAARDERERDGLWEIRRAISPALRLVAPRKINHDVVVPMGRIPDLFRVIDEIRRAFGVRVVCFGHAGDGNIHVNIMVDDTPEELARARVVARRLFEQVVALDGSISGEHGIGYAKAPYLSLELSPEVVALSKRLKQAFDPHGILNPGKIFDA